MSSRTSATPPQLPDELTESMHRIASITGSASQPWPAVDQTIKRQRQRQRRRRAAAAGTALTVALIAGLGGGAVLLNDGDDTTRNLHAASQVAEPDAKIPPEVRELGYAGTAGGSLASNEAFIEGVRTRVAGLAPAGGTPDALQVIAKDVLVFWAGDVSGSRMALVGYQPVDGTHTKFTISVLIGAAGDPAAKMTFSRPDTTYRLGEDGLSGDDGRGNADIDVATFPPVVVIGPGEEDSPVLPAMVFVLAPKAHVVGIATNEKFPSADQIDMVDRPLAKQGDVVWVSSMSALEYRLREVSVDGDRFSFPGGTINAPADATTQVLKDVALPGTDQSQLALAGDAIDTQLQPIGDEMPVLAQTADLGDGGKLTAGVLKSSQGYLVGWALEAASGRSPANRRDRSLASNTKQPSSTPDTLMTAFQLGFSNQTYQAPVAVLAPAGAVTIRIGSNTAPVQNRLGLLYIQSPEPQNLNAPQHSVTIQALDENGQVIGSTKIDGIE